MKRIAGIVLGIVLFLISVFFYDAYLDSKITENKETVRNHRTVERFMSREVAGLVMDENTLPIFGSSELCPLKDYNTEVSSFINSHDMNIMTIGGGYFQTLSHTMALGAIEEDIESRTVALFISPQWFGTDGIGAEAFASRFSEDELLGFLENKKISKEKKQYVLNRATALLASSPVQQGRVKKYADSCNNIISANTLYRSVMSAFWKVKAKYNVVKQIDDMSFNLPEVDLENMDWESMLQLAEKQGEEACTNNDFGIYDEYWDTYVKDTYEQGEVTEKCQIFTESVEYDDLRCFLDVAKELEIRVLLVSVPVNEKWYSYQGMLCDQYYRNIYSISQEYSNVELIDMTVYENEKYFLKDIMHLGWKGWAMINEELYKRFAE